MDDQTITAVPGVAVGHHTDQVAATGVTVLTFPEPNVSIVDVRGGAPGTRETDALGAASNFTSAGQEVLFGHDLVEYPGFPRFG